MPETDRCGFVTATTFRHLKRLSFHCPMITTLSIFSETNYAPLDWNNNGGGGSLENLEYEGGHNIQLLHFQDIHFKYLTTLSTWGGTLKWNFLHQFGTQLTVLKLVHVEEITLESMLNILANTCPQLAKLELQNCALNDNVNSGVISSRKTSSTNEKTSSSSLKELTITSKCSERFVEKILTFCPALEVLELGTSVDLTDAVLEAVCIRSSSKFSMAKLKTFKVGFSDKLTLRSVQFLLEYCPDICEISDLSSFSLVTKMDIQDLQESLSKSNSDVQLYWKYLFILSNLFEINYSLNWILVQPVIITDPDTIRLFISVYPLTVAISHAAHSWRWSFVIFRLMFFHSEEFRRNLTTSVFPYVQTYINAFNALFNPSDESRSYILISFLYYFCNMSASKIIEIL